MVVVGGDGDLEALVVGGMLVGGGRSGEVERSVLRMGGCGLEGEDLGFSLGGAGLWMENS